MVVSENLCEKTLWTDILFYLLWDYSIKNTQRSLIIQIWLFIKKKNLINEFQFTNFHLMKYDCNSKVD